MSATSAGRLVYPLFIGPQDLQERIAPFDPPAGIEAPLSDSPVDSAGYSNARLGDCNEFEGRIRFDYHPASKRPSQTFSSYEESLEETGYNIDREIPSKPYAPFPTFADFDFTEFVLEHRLSSSVINDLLKRLHTTWASQVLVTMETAEELEQYVKMSIEPTVAVLGCLFAQIRPLMVVDTSLRKPGYHLRIKLPMEIPCTKNTVFFCAPFGTGFPPL